MKRELTPAQVRALPDGTMVNIHSTDKYGYPQTRTAFVHRRPTGETVLHGIGMYDTGFISIRARKGWTYTMEVEDA